MTENINPWTGRDDSAESGDTKRVYQLVNANFDNTTKNTNVILGFASDAGVKRNHGRTGASQAPFHIRKALANLAAHELTNIHDAGDINCEGDALERAQSQLGKKVEQILAQNNKLVVLGGGHEIAWGTFNGLYGYLNKRYENDLGSILIINIDAHFDLRSSPIASSGTPFHQILEFSKANNINTKYAVFGISKSSNTASLFAQAKQFDVFYKEDKDMQAQNLDQRLSELDELIKNADHVYLTIDIDCLPGYLAPGVSAPAVLGVPLVAVEAFINKIKASGKLRVADIAEVCPAHDDDNRTVKAAARIVWDILS